MSQNNAENGGIFINGKKQVVELLQRMDASDKTKLLKNIRLKKILVKGNKFYFI